MLSFASAVGNLFNRLGKIGAVIKTMRSNQATQFTSLVDTASGIVAQLNAEADVQAIIGDSYIGILNSLGSPGGTMQACAAAVVNRMIFRDNPQLNQTLTSANTLVSLQEVIRQMKVQGASVLAQTITSTPTGFVGVGNGVVTTSVRRPLDGLVLENTFTENMLITCTQDSYNGNATAGNEQFSITGVGSQSDLFAFNWPLGSNCSISLNAIDGSADNSSGNELTNSDFEDWTANVPDNWELVTGTAGTDIAEETGITFGGTSCLRVTGDGTTLVQIRQKFDDSTVGTGGDLESITQYSVNVFIRRDGVAPATGQWTVDILDGNGVVINDQNGVANTFTIDLTALTTQFASYSAPFRLPVIMPTTIYFRMRMPTGQALESGRSVYIARVSLGEMSQTYTSGPFIAVHSGSVPFTAGTYANNQFTNSRGAAGTYATFQTLLAQLFPSEVYGSELLFPSSATPTLSDSTLIA